MAQKRTRTGSVRPQDPGLAFAHRHEVAEILVWHASLGQWTAGSTVVPAPRLAADVALVVREIWVVGSAIPNDADGDLDLTILAYDPDEVATDTLVNAQDMETLLAVAEKAYKATLVAEGTGSAAEPIHTIQAGGSLRANLISSDAGGIDTNADISLAVVYQRLGNIAGG